MKKKSGFLLKSAALALASLLVLSKPQKANSLENHLFWGFGFDMNYKTSTFVIPEYIRNVPIHPDDTYVPKENAGPIKGSQFKPGKRETYEGNFGIDLRHNRFMGKIGLAVGVDTYKKDDSDFRERNYTNHVGTEERGYGAALTYYSFEGKPLTGFMGGLFARAGFKIMDISDKYKLNLFAEHAVKFSKTKIDIETGWDRWNSLQEYKTYEIPLKTMTNTTKLGLEFEIKEGNSYLVFPEAYVGLSYSKFVLGDTKYSQKPSLIFGMGAKYLFDFPKIKSSIKKS